MKLPKITDAEAEELLTQHTPGNWEAEKTKTGWAISNGSIYLAKIGDNVGNPEANARLMARAPDLLITGEWAISEIKQLRRDKTELVAALRRADIILAAPFGTYNGADFEGVHIQVQAVIARHGKES